MNTPQARPSSDDTNSGQLICSRTPILFIKALNENFDGSLVLKSGAGERIAYFFRAGIPQRVHTSVAKRVVWTAISEQLPPEQLALVDQHAAQHGIDALSAIQQLVLLPDSAIFKLHEDCLRRQTEWMSHLPGKFIYRYFPNANCFHDKPGLSQQCEPLSLIVECLRKSPDLSWCREQLQASRQRPLILMGRLATASYPLHGVLRQVVAALRKEEDSFESLRLRRIAPEKTLVAVIYALRSTGCAASPHAPAVSSRSMPSSGAISQTRRIPSKSIPSSRREQPTTGKRLARPSNSSTKTVLPPCSSVAPRLSTAPFSTLPPHSVIQARRTHPTVRSPSSSGVQKLNTAVTTPAMPVVRPTPCSITPQNENNIEASALQAWMRAVDEPRSRGKALSVAQRAAGHFPKNPRILFYLGCILALTGNTPGAEATLQLVLEIDPDHSEAARELRRLNAQEASLTDAQKKDRPSLLMRFGRKKHG